MNRRILTAAISASGMLVLIIDGKTGLLGAADGIELCIKSVIPSLFPFFVLSSILTSSLWGSRLFAPLAGFCGMARGSESLLIVGLLGGYPVGAQNIARAWQQGALSKEQANRMLAFCSNAGPSFFFGIVASRFSSQWAGLALWIIHILSALTVGHILPNNATENIRLSEQYPMTLPNALRESVKTMANVCAWVILFRIMIAFLERWVIQAASDPVRIVIAGTLELTNGCCSLDKIADERLRFITASVMLGTGGLCVLMQTLSVANGLSIRNYVLGKALQGVFSLILSAGAAYIGPSVPLLLVAAGFLVINLKKYVEITQTLIYNKRKKASQGGSYAVPKEN